MLSRRRSSSRRNGLTLLLLSVLATVPSILRGAPSAFAKDPPGTPSGSAPTPPPPPPRICNGVDAAVMTQLNADLAANDVLVVSYGVAGSSPCLHGRPDAPSICLPYQYGKDSDIHPPLVPANKPIRIRIIRPEGYSGQIAADGTPQESATAIAGSASPLGSRLQGNAEPHLAGSSYACIVETWDLAPRAPGAVKITASLLDPNGGTYKASSHVVELIVEGVYVGAIRVGIGAIVPFGQWSAQNGGPTYGVSSYSIRNSPQGGSAIYRDSWSPAELELVGGYTAFLSKRKLSNLGEPGFGLFGGLGLLAVAPASGSVTGLTSGYLGLEFSWRGLSFLGVGGVRRETVLLDGYHVGTHVASGANITGTGYVPAIGLVVGFTSDVLKIPGTYVH